MNASTAIKEGLALLSKMPAAINQIQGLVESSFSYKTLKPVESRFVDSLAKSELNPSENAELTALVSSVRDEVAQALNMLLALKCWIRVQVPKIEDGNNFGVSVQMEVIKAIDDLITPIRKALEDIPSYFEKRATAWEKVAKKTSKETKKSSSESQETGGKDGDASKTSKSCSSEEKVSETSSPPDAMQHIVALDLKCYVSLHHTLMAARDALMIVGDMIDKNMEKLQRPKGTNQSSGMYAY